MVFLKKINVLIICLVLLSSTPLPNGSAIDEYLLKAAFMYRFTEYIDWQTDPETFNIGILGESAIKTHLLEISRTKKAKNKRIIIMQSEDLSDVSSCQILFVSKNYNHSIENVISKVSGKNVLIITEDAGYAARGSHINFYLSDNQLKFEINQKAAARAGLRISSQLLQHAIIVE